MPLPYPALNVAVGEGLAWAREQVGKSGPYNGTIRACRGAMRPGASAQYTTHRALRGV